MGRFDTHGGTFVPQGFMQIEAGGTHEENPNGGVQVGVDPNGIPNMVEQDENIYEDFVYSNQINDSFISQCQSIFVCKQIIAYMFFLVRDLFYR